MNKKPLKIVVTGGPGGGKTTALDLFQREYMNQLNVVPEAASLMFSAGMGRETDIAKIKLSQLAIYKMQKNLEESFTNLARGELLLCDRGTLDGLAYWPDSEEDYYRTLKTSLEAELSEYHGVIFFQTSAATGNAIKSNNPFRTEDSIQATKLDKKLQEIWSKHPNYHFVPNHTSFMKKIGMGIVTINKVLLDSQLKFKRE